VACLGPMAYCSEAEGKVGHREAAPVGQVVVDRESGAVQMKS